MVASLADITFGHVAGWLTFIAVATCAYYVLKNATLEAMAQGKPFYGSGPFGGGDGISPGDGFGGSGDSCSGDGGGCGGDGSGGGH